jgi:hypothetical protein
MIFKNQIVLFSFYIFLFISNCYSDDTAIAVFGGNAKAIYEHSSVRMLGENVKITLNTDDYDVDATFTFYNEDKSTEVLVGFPQKGFGDGATGTNDYNEYIVFKTFVNDQEVKFLNLESMFESNENRYSKWKTKAVYFPAKVITHTKVLYKVPYGGGAYSKRNKFIDYIIGTGSSWLGNIGKSTFTLVFNDDIQLNIDDNPFSSINKFKFERTSKNEMNWFVDEFEPDINANFRIYLTTPTNYHAQPWFNYENDAFYRAKNFYTNEFIPKSILEKLSMSQLRFLRNEFYARHGKKFINKELNEYFNSFNWYISIDDFKENDLNLIEKKNIQIILSYEKELLKK